MKQGRPAKTKHCLSRGVSPPRIGRQIVELIDVVTSPTSALARKRLAYHSVDVPSYVALSIFAHVHIRTCAPAHMLLEGSSIRSLLVSCP